MHRRPRPTARDARDRRTDDTIARLLALALAALAITTIPQARLADLLTAAAWVTVLASLLLAGLLLRRQARAPERKGRPLDNTSETSPDSPPEPPPAPNV